MFELLPEADEVPGGAIDALSGEQQAKPKPRPTQERKKLKQMVQKSKPAYGVFVEFGTVAVPNPILGKYRNP